MCFSFILTYQQYFVGWRWRENEALAAVEKNQQTPRRDLRQERDIRAQDEKKNFA